MDTSLLSACSRVWANNPSEWGTAWLLSPRHAMTAAHCVGRLSSEATLAFHWGELPAKVVALDDEVDWAILEFESLENRFPTIIPTIKSGLPFRSPEDATPALFPLGILPANLSDSVLSWSAFGYPAAEPEGLRLSGTVTGNNSITRKLELLCWQGGLSGLEGSSGAAICIQGRAVALIHAGPPDLQQRVVTAVPMSNIIAGALEQLNQDEHPEAIKVLRQACAIAVDEFDRSLALYLEAVRSLGNRSAHLHAIEQRLDESASCGVDSVYVDVCLRQLHVGTLVVDDKNSTVPADNAAGACPPIAHSVGPRIDVGETLNSLATAAEPQHLFIFGEPGAGKSTLLRRIAARAWHDPGSLGLNQPYLPLFIRLNQALCQIRRPYEEWFRRSLEEGELTLPSNTPTQFLEVWPQRANARWLFVFDGFDEVPRKNRQKMADCLQEILEKCKATGLVSSRPPQSGDKEVLDVCRLCQNYELLPLNSEQQDLLCEKWLGSATAIFQRQLNHVDWGLIQRTPLLITIAATVYRKHGFVPTKRCDLFRRVIAAGLDEAREHGLEDDLPPDSVPIINVLLEEIALAVTDNASLTNKELIQNVIAPYLCTELHLGGDVAKSYADVILSVMGRRSGILSLSEHTVGWWHETFREFLAASALLRKKRIEELDHYMQFFGRPAWQEVHMFLFLLLNEEHQHDPAKIDQVTELMQKLLFSDGENSRQALFAAAAMSQGLILAPALKNQLIQYLVQAVEKAGPQAGCEFYFSDLTESGRNPLDLLANLVSDPVAEDGLIRLIHNRSMQPWAQLQLVEAAMGAGLRAEVATMLARPNLDHKVRQAITRHLTETIH